MWLTFQNYDLWLSWSQSALIYIYSLPHYLFLFRIQSYVILFCFCQSTRYLSVCCKVRVKAPTAMLKLPRQWKGKLYCQAWWLVIFMICVKTPSLTHDQYSEVSWFVYFQLNFFPLFYDCLLLLGELHYSPDPCDHGQEDEHQEHVRHRSCRPWQVYPDRLLGEQGRYHCSIQGRRGTFHRHKERWAGALYYHQVDVSINM